MTLRPWDSLSSAIANDLGGGGDFICMGTMMSIMSEELNA